MKKYFNLYKTVFKFAIIKNMAYPQDFLVWSVVDLLWSCINLGFFKVLLLRIPSISGWTFEQLTIILGLVHILSAFVWGAMYGNMKELVKDINKGNLDLYLTKPANSQFLVSTKELSFNLFPTFLIGLFLVTYGLFTNGKFTLPSMAVVLVSIASSIIISYSIWFITVTSAMFFGRLANVAELFPNALDIARYPVSIFPPFIQFLFTFIIPFALIGFVPANIILGKTSYLVLILAPVSAFILLYISNRFWNFALRHYSSASS